MIDTNLRSLCDAIVFAENAHKGQVRKYTGEPYFTHCFAVAKMVVEHGGDTNMVIAALLHDTVEDTDVTSDDIFETFGPDVAMLVEWLTDVSRPEDGNRAVRKRIDCEHTAKANPRAKTIKLADLIHNTESIVKHDKAFAKVYLAEKRLLLQVLKEGNAELYRKALIALEEGEGELEYYGF